MPVPFEALLPYAVVTLMFTVSGVGIHSINYIQNGWKPKRHNVDVWDRYEFVTVWNWEQDIDTEIVMERDYRLTNKFRGQNDLPTAPPGFELNSRWKMENRIK